MDARSRRTQFFTARSIQIQYVVIVLGFMFALLLASGIIFYVSGWLPLVERLANVYPQGRLQGVLREIYLRLLISFALMAPLAVSAAMIVSHRVAGPLVRIRRYLQLIARGEYDLAPLGLRRNDELKDVAALINMIIERERAGKRRDA